MEEIITIDFLFFKFNSQNYFIQNVRSKKEFPITSQTSDQDKISLLRIRELLSVTESYSFIEIGSYFGGSIYPFAKDPLCEKILSIDKRNQKIPDERGAVYNYAGTSVNDMIGNLKSANIPTEKIINFDGDISEIKGHSRDYDFAFIGGEHTHEACFRDFIYADKLLKENSIIAFHDSSLTYKALQIIHILLEANQCKFRFVKIKNSEIAIFFRGTWAYLEIQNHFEIEDDLRQFYKNSENFVLLSNIRNRVNISISEPPTLDS